MGPIRRHVDGDNGGEGDDDDDDGETKKLHPAVTHVESEAWRFLRLCCTVYVVVVVFFVLCVICVIAGAQYTYWFETMTYLAPVDTTVKYVTSTRLAQSLSNVKADCFLSATSRCLGGSDGGLFRRQPQLQP